MKWLKKRLASWLLNATQEQLSELFSTRHAIGNDGEVVINDRSIWINVDAKCVFRVAAAHIVLDDRRVGGNDDVVPTEYSRADRRRTH